MKYPVVLRARFYNRVLSHAIAEHVSNPLEMPGYFARYGLAAPNHRELDMLRRTACIMSTLPEAAEERAPPETPAEFQTWAIGQARQVRSLWGVDSALAPFLLAQGLVIAEPEEEPIVITEPAIKAELAAWVARSVARGGKTSLTRLQQAFWGAIAHRCAPEQRSPRARAKVRHIIKEYYRDAVDEHGYVVGITI